MKRDLLIVLIMHTQLFYWAAQILHKIFDIPIWISTLQLDDDGDDDEANRVDPVCKSVKKRLYQVNCYMTTLHSNDCI